MNTLLPLLNPAGNLTVEKAEEIARLICNERERFTYGDQDGETIRLIKSYEKFKEKKLSKEMFVCEVEHPVLKEANDFNILGTTDYYHKKADYIAAERKVIFEGFEVMGDVAWIKQIRSTRDVVRILFNPEFSILYSFFGTRIKKATIGDLFTEIERYNRTATSKIELKFTENVLKELL